MTCPGGETPVLVRTGCLCGDTILNPCESGGLGATLEGKTCVFQCPVGVAPSTAAEKAEMSPMERCLDECNEKSGWRFMGQCEMTCGASAP